MYNTQVKPAAPTEETAQFFRTSNRQYGENWQASGDDPVNPAKKDNVPLYHEIGEREKGLAVVKRVFKHKLLQEMREAGELDTEVHEKNKTMAQMIKKADVEAKPFPTRAEEMKYPEPVMNKGNPLYTTSNTNYGGKLPQATDTATKFYPKNTSFTSTFLGGNFADTGLNTAVNPSRVHAHFDQHS